MTLTPHLASDSAACCWISLFALRCELARRPELASRPVALLAPDTARTPRVWQVAPLARRAGVKPGMTVSQAIGLCPALKLCEPDPVHYDEQFSRLAAALVTVSPVVEPVELGGCSWAPMAWKDCMEGRRRSWRRSNAERGTRNAEQKWEARSTVPRSHFRVPRFE